MAQKTPIPAKTIVLSGTWSSLWYLDLTDVLAAWTSSLHHHHLTGGYFNYKRRLLNITSVFQRNHLIYNNTSSAALAAARRKYGAWRRVQGRRLLKPLHRPERILGRYRTRLAFGDSGEHTISYVFFRARPRYWFDQNPEVNVRANSYFEMNKQLSTVRGARLALQLGARKRVLQGRSRSARSTNVRAARALQQHFIRLITAEQLPAQPKLRWRGARTMRRLVRHFRRSGPQGVVAQLPLPGVMKALKPLIRRLRNQKRRTQKGYGYAVAVRRNRTRLLLQRAHRLRRRLGSQQRRLFRTRANPGTRIEKGAEFTFSSLADSINKVIPPLSLPSAVQAVITLPTLSLNTVNRATTVNARPNWSLAQAAATQLAGRLLPKWRWDAKTSRKIKPRRPEFNFWQRYYRLRVKQAKKQLRRKRVLRRTLSLSMLKSALQRVATFPTRVTHRRSTSHLGILRRRRFRVIFARWRRKPYFLTTILVIAWSVFRARCRMVVLWTVRLLKKQKKHSGIFNLISSGFKYFLTDPDAHRVYEHSPAGGARILANGKIDGGDMAKSFRFQVGAIPTRTFAAPMERAFGECKTRYGVIRMTISLFMKPLYFRRPWPALEYPLVTAEQRRAQRTKTRAERQLQLKEERAALKETETRRQRRLRLLLTQSKVAIGHLPLPHWQDRKNR